LRAAGKIYDPVDVARARRAGGGWCKNKPVVYFCTNLIKRLEKTFQLGAYFIEFLQRFEETN